MLSFKFLIDRQATNLRRRITLQPFLIDKTMFAKAIERSLVREIRHRNPVVCQAEICGDMLVRLIIHSLEDIRNG